MFFKYHWQSKNIEWDIKILHFFDKNKNKIQNLIDLKNFFFNGLKLFSFIGQFEYLTLAATNSKPKHLVNLTFSQPVHKSSMTKVSRQQGTTQLGKWVIKLH